MDAKQRTERLRALMAHYGLKAKQVGEILDRDAQTVREWMCNSPTRNIPANLLRQLELELDLARRATK